MNGWIGWVMDWQTGPESIFPPCWAMDGRTWRIWIKTVQSSPIISNSNNAKTKPYYNADTVPVPWLCHLLNKRNGRKVAGNVPSCPALITPLHIILLWNGWKGMGARNAVQTQLNTFLLYLFCIASKCHAPYKHQKSLIPIRWRSEFHCLKYMGEEI